MPLDDIEKQIARLREEIAGQCGRSLSAASATQVALALLDVVEDIVQAIIAEEGEGREREQRPE